MKFGLLLPPGVRAVAEARAAEDAGFASVFIVDSPMIFGDPYVSMAAAAGGTTRLTVAIGVTNPRTRSAPVTASSVASLGVFAPGRIGLGIGVGFTANRAMGARNATVAELERYVLAVRDLLRGEVAEVDLDGATVPVQFLNREPSFVNLNDRIPLYMAAMGPRTLALAGRLADGVILGGITEPALIDRCRALIDEGARSVGRRVDDLEIAVTPSTLVTDREPAFEDLRDALGPKSLAPAMIYGRMAESTPAITPGLAEDMARVRTAAYEQQAKGAKAEADPRRHLVAYRGYLTQLQPWQSPLITPRVLAATSVAGTVAQCTATVRRLAEHGVGHVILSPRPQDLAPTIERFGRDIIPRFTEERGSSGS